MMIACEREFLKIHEGIERLWESVCRARADGWRIDEVERAVFAELMQMGLHVMKAFVDGAGDGDLGETLEVPAATAGPQSAQLFGWVKFADWSRT